MTHTGLVSLLSFRGGAGYLLTQFRSGARFCLLLSEREEFRRKGPTQKGGSRILTKGGIRVRDGSTTGTVSAKSAIHHSGPDPLPGPRSRLPKPRCYPKHRPLPRCPRSSCQVHQSTQALVFRKLHAGVLAYRSNILHNTST